MTQPNLFLTPRHPALLAGFDNDLDVLLRFQAPPQTDNARERSALNLAIVLDRSGSMSGEPLEEAKRCAHLVIDRLGPKDRAAIVIYDDQVEVLHRSTTVIDKERFHAAINRIEEGGMTNLHGGWLAGVEEVSRHLAQDTISRVILLSDGQANEGLTDPDAIGKQCAELAEAGVTTSTYGLGHHFNEELMIRMARDGQGNSYYGRTAKDLMDPFQEEFDLLSALYAKQIRLAISSADGTSVKLLNEFSKDADGAYQIPDLAYEGEAWAVLRVHIPKHLTGNGDGSSMIDILDGSISYQDIDGKAQKVSLGKLALPSLSAAAWNAITEDELVARRVGELEAASIQDRAQGAARRGDWKQVRHLLREARNNAKNCPSSYNLEQSTA